MDDVIGGFVDLALHLNRLLFVLGDLDPENPEVGPSQIQRDEVALLCGVGGESRVFRGQMVGDIQQKFKQKALSASLAPPYGRMQSLQRSKRPKCKRTHKVGAFIQL